MLSVIFASRRTFNFFRKRLKSGEYFFYSSACQKYLSSLTTRHDERRVRSEGSRQPTRQHDISSFSKQWSEQKYHIKKESSDDYGVRKAEKCQEIKRRQLEGPSPGRR
jgi:hypothetical protein